MQKGTLRRTNTKDQVRIRYELRDSAGNMVESRGIDSRLWKMFMPGQLEIKVVFGPYREDSRRQIDKAAPSQGRPKGRWGK